jgi:tetratricopeptide (TPR) repeat protein
LAEAIEQLNRALGQVATLPSTPALRREEIRLQVALIYPLQHLKGYASPEAKAAAERVILLIEETEAVGEPPEDPRLLFRALHGLFVANVAAFRGDLARESAARLMALADKLGGKVPLMRGHAAMGSALLWTGNFAEAVVHLDQTIALEHDPVENRRRGYSSRVTALQSRSLALWALGYPEAAFASAEQALDVARETGFAGALMWALPLTGIIQFISGDYVTKKALLIDELIALAEEKGSIYWKTAGMLRRASLVALSDKASDAVPIFTSAIAV